MSNRGQKKPSDTGLAVVELQKKLPKARVLYLSATGATEVSNFAYATRLGLWGPGTAFANAQAFVTGIEAAGVAGMEILAKDVKAMGLYVARALSFHGVEYGRIDHELTEEQIDTYNTLSEGWSVVLQNFNSALQIVASKSDGKVDGKAKSRAMSAFWGANQRFWNFVVTSMALPSVIDDMEQTLASGESCVLQLVNTNEAAMERQLAKMTEADDLEDINLTPKDHLIQLVQHSFPVTQHESFIDENGNEQVRVATDSQGNPIQNRQAVQMREELLDKIALAKAPPDGPLEMILSHFGPQNCAEVTGRSRRVVRVHKDGVDKTTIETRSQSKCLAEVEEFMSGKRRILIFSDAGGTGASYHASRKVANQQKRKHYLIQPGWVADQAVQGFGRTHRSDQVVPPSYVLCSTNLRGQARFISSIARRLDQLGALTKGERKSARGGLFARMTDNLESSHAREALYILFRDIHAGHCPEVSVESFELATGLKLQDDEGNLLQKLPVMSRFLNRLLNLKVHEQQSLFDRYMERLEATITRHMEAGTLDIGAEVVRADKIEKISEKQIYQCPRTGAKTHLVEVKLSWKTKPVTWEEVNAGGKSMFFKKPAFFAKNTRSGIVWAFFEAMDRTSTKTGAVERHYRQTGIRDHHFVRASEIDYGGNWIKFYEDNYADVKSDWDNQVANAPEWHTVTTYMICGLTLPIFDRLPSHDVKVKVMRVSDTGERLLGRVIPTSELKEVMSNFGIEADVSSYSPEELVEMVMGGKNSLKLANGWIVKSSYIAYERRMELVGPTHIDIGFLKGIGIVFERRDYKAYFTFGRENPEVSLAELIRLKPLASIVST